MSKQQLIDWLQQYRDVEEHSSFDAAIAEAHQMKQLFLQELADRLQPQINKIVAERQHSTVGGRIRFGQWLTALLAQLDLAVVCPNTGLPGFVQGDGSGGRYQTRVRCEDGEWRVTASTPSISALKLVPHSPRRSHTAFASWGDLPDPNPRGPVR